MRLPIHAILVAGFLGAQDPASQLRPVTPEPPPGHLSAPDGSRLSLQLAGTGTRQRFQVDFYEVALYVDLEALRRRVGPDRSDDLPSIQAALASGRVPLLFRTTFLHEAGGSANLRFMHQALKAYWPDGTFDPEAPALVAFNAFFGQVMPRGFQDQVYLDGKGALWLLRRREKPLRVAHPVLAEAYARMHFGDPPRDAALRERLTRALVHKLVTRGSGKR